MQSRALLQLDICANAVGTPCGLPCHRSWSTLRLFPFVTGTMAISSEDARHNPGLRSGQYKIGPLASLIERGADEAPVPTAPRNKSRVSAN